MTDENKPKIEDGVAQTPQIGLAALVKAAENARKDDNKNKMAAKIEEIEQQQEDPKPAEPSPEPATPPTTKTAFFLRNGTNLRVPLDVPNFGEFEVVFENAMVSLGEKLTLAMRNELKRNARLAQNVYEYDADDETVTAIVQHHQRQAMQRQGGSSGLSATINSNANGDTEFRDPSLYDAQPKGRHADELLRGKQAKMAT